MARPPVGVYLHDGAVMPTYAHPDVRHYSGGDAGADLSALYHYNPITEESVRIKDLTGGRLVIHPGGQRVVGTGVHMALPAWYRAVMYSRSGLSAKLAVEVGGGLLDNGYGGEYRVILHNHGLKALVIQEGDRIAQVCIEKYEQADFKQLVVMPETRRGANGYASTGGVSALAHPDPHGYAAVYGPDGYGGAY